MSDDEVIDGELVDSGQPNSDSLVAIDEVTRAEIDIQIATARRFPRDLVKAQKNMVAMATLDPEVAESCFYSLKRKDEKGKPKLIQGESIRMAEIAMSCFGNIRAGTRILGETEDRKFVRVLGVCHDLENNVSVGREVARSIHGKRGRFSQDMVGVTIAAAGAIALRNAVVATIPRAIIRPAFLKAKEVATGKTKSLVERRAQVVERLIRLAAGITEEKIVAACGKSKLEELGWDEITHLIGLGTAIKDGVQSVEEAFPDPAAAGTMTVEELSSEKPSGTEAGPSGDPSQEGGPSPAGDAFASPPWETITADESASLAKRLAAIGLSPQDLVMTVMGDETFPLDKLPKAKLDKALEILESAEKKSKPKK